VFTGHPVGLENQLGIGVVPLAPVRRSSFDASRVPA
jgi:hypothetical protein